MEPSKSKNTCICCENSVGVTLLFIWHILYGTLLKLTYPKFISVFRVKYT